MSHNLRVIIILTHKEVIASSIVRQTRFISPALQIGYGVVTMARETRSFRFFILTCLVVGVLLLTLPSGSAQQPTYYPTQTYTVSTSVNYTRAGTISPSGNNSYTYGSYIVFCENTNPGYSFNGWYLNGIYEGKLSSLPVSM